MTVLDKLKARFVARERATATGYAEAVAAVAAGKAIDVDTLAELIDAAGRTADRFERDVTDRAERYPLRGAARRTPALEAELADLAHKAAAVAKERDETLAAFAGRLEPLAVRQAAVEAEMAAARAAADRLRGGLPADHLAKLAVREAGRRHEAAHARVQELRGLVDRGTVNLRQVEHAPDGFHPGEADKVRARLARYVADLADAEGERAAALAEVDRLTAALEDA